MRALLAVWFVAMSGAPALAQDPCVTSAPQVVDDVYQHVLKRSADPGSAGLSQQLASGQMTVRDVVAILAHSEEYASRFFWPPVVTEAYRQILERPPTGDEMRLAATALASRRITPDTLVADLATRAANNEPESIRVIYRRLLGRDPDPEGFIGYRRLAEREGLGAVTRTIVSSPEYRSRAASNPQNIAAYAQAVRAMYLQLLDREADPNGLMGLTELATVYGPRGPIDRMLGSAEYRDKYGPNGIPGRAGAKFCIAR